MFFFFSDRNRLAKEFEKWAEENKAKVCPLNVITFLYTREFLNEEKIKEFIRNNKND